MSEKEAEEILAKLAPHWREHLWGDDVLLADLVANLGGPRWMKVHTTRRIKDAN